MQATARILTSLLFDLKVYGTRHIPKSGGVLIVSNHQSNLDPVLIGVRLYRPLSYIAKSELFQNRLAAWLLRELNAFPVRQGKGDVGAVKETIRRLREGHMLNIYPEGQRTPDGLIQTMQKGAALIIKRSGVPVIPAAIVGAFEAWPIHRPFLRPWPIRVKFGPAMNLNGDHTDEAITASIEFELRGMYARMQKRAQDESS